MVFSLYFSSVPINPFSKFRLLWDQSGSIVIIFVGNKALVHFHPFYISNLVFSFETNGIEKFRVAFSISYLSLMRYPLSELTIFIILVWDVY